MRWICWVSALLAAYGLASSTALGAEGICAGCGHYGGYGAPTCMGPFFGMLPGCCQCQPHCCDNAWAGYCLEKARRQAFWYRVGTRGPSRVGCASNGREPTSVISGPAEQSLPLESGKPARPDEAPLPPLPELPPEKTSWRWNGPWLR